MSGHPDIQRLIGDVVRYATIASVDHGAARCIVTVGDLQIGPIPWHTGRAGGTSNWSAPTVGEQCLLLCPEGDSAAGVALLGIYSDANMAPAKQEGLDVQRFADDATISYDAQAHKLVATLPDGGSAEISAPGGIIITGPVKIIGDVDLQGTLTSSADVVASGTSLHGHTHDLVNAGTDKSGAPSA